MHFFQSQEMSKMLYSSNEIQKRTNVGPTYALLPSAADS